MRQLDARIEVFLGRAHATALVERITEAAQGFGFGELRIHPPCHRQRRFMLSKAVIHPPQQKVDIAAQRSNLCNCTIVLGSLRHFLGILEFDERFLVAIRYRERFGQTDPGAAPLGVGRCVLDGYPKSFNSVVDLANFAKRFAVYACKLEPFGFYRGELAASCRQTRYLREMKSLNFSPRRNQIGCSCTRIFSSVEMLSAKDRIGTLKPLAGAAMQV